jgi:hypothetical protein
MAVSAIGLKGTNLKKITIEERFDTAAAATSRLDSIETITNVVSSLTSSVTTTTKNTVKLESWSITQKDQKVLSDDGKSTTTNTKYVLKYVLVTEDFFAN